MKTLLILWLIFIFSFSELYAFAITDTLSTSPTLFEKITQRRIQNQWLHIDLNTRIAFHTSLDPNNAEQSAFRLDYLRLQVEGEITDRIYYKWLQHLNRNNNPHSLDNTPSSIDCLGVGFRITPTLSTFIGKQYADFGGFEYDANPAEVYDYSDMGDYITCFLVGINFSWCFTPTQEIRFQIVDGRSDKAEELYGNSVPDFKPAKTPLGYTLNWNGNFFKEQLYTRCSFSLFHEGQAENVYFLALAAAWIQNNFNIYIDGMYSIEDIDKLGILSEILPENEMSRRKDCRYLSLISRINYRIFPKINLFAKGIYETNSVNRQQSGLPKGKYCTSYGYQGGIEYFPIKENLRFFVMYRGRKISYTKKAENLGVTKEYPRYLSLGLIYKIPVF